MKFSEWLGEEVNKELKDVLKQIVKVRDKYKATSDAGMLLGIFRDILSSASRKSLIDKYLEELKTFQEDGFTFK
jgi:hypothetical protein